MHLSPTSKLGYLSFNIVKWPFQRGWSLIRVASLKGFHCIKPGADQATRSN